MKEEFINDNKINSFEKNPVNGGTPANDNKVKVVIFKKKGLK